MRRLYVICEGPTEQNFCCDLLGPHLAPLKIYLHAPLIKKSGGGLVKWSILKKDLLRFLAAEPGCYVTTLIDFYGLTAKHQFPEWADAQSKNRPADQVATLEHGMRRALATDLQQRFLPYIQLHEFEALLFADGQVYQGDFFSPDEVKDLAYLEHTLANFPHPEAINSGKSTAPSKRLERIIKSYAGGPNGGKVVLGPLIAAEIGLPKIRQKCPRFNAWVERLEDLAPG